ncbi:MAG: aminotransferase class V-fold PLP-dependent enzyme [Clostridiales bacterium]|nr:aminotransferase class V-fold PLP-dependent enzyme [Clostridiales bacterium]
MISFASDYTTGAHPSVLEALEKINLRSTKGYGTDEDCARAEKTIQALCNAPDAQVHFLVGGTQANLTLIAAALRPHEAVICAETGHINVHETGAIEAIGHKVLGIPTNDGKITPETIEAMVARHPDEHMVKPALVYISNTTEVGTVYTAQEIEAISACCKKLGLFLYLDGARIGSAIQAGGAPLDVLARCCDAFTIGGTKNGALFGEAMVLIHPALQRDFRYIIKQNGGMLAKGWLLGAQFEALLKDGTYFSIAAHANAMAEKIAAAMLEKGYVFAYPPVSNQLFVIMSDAQAEKIAQNVIFQLGEARSKDQNAWRFVTSWSTRPEDVETLISLL